MRSRQLGDGVGGVGGAGDGGHPNAGAWRCEKKEERQHLAKLKEQHQILQQGLEKTPEIYKNKGAKKQNENNPIHLLFSLHTQ